MGFLREQPSKRRVSDNGLRLGRKKPPRTGRTGGEDFVSFGQSVSRRNREARNTPQAPEEEIPQEQAPVASPEEQAQARADTASRDFLKAKLLEKKGVAKGKKKRLLGE